MVTLLSLSIALLALSAGECRASPSVPPSNPLPATDTSPPSSTFYPTPRTITPDFPRLHILFVLSMATYTHVAAPIEYLLELQRRGHRVTWQQPSYLRLFRSEEERLSLPFNFSFVDVSSVNISHLDRMNQLITERPWLEVFGEFASQTYELIYPNVYRGMLAQIEQDRPDLVLCDSVADHCIDITNQLHLSSVIAHCTTHILTNH